MSLASPSPIVAVVQQHAEEVAVLRHIRSVLLRAPHVQLHRLRRLDDRIAAHLDGLHESGAAGLACLRQELSEPSAGIMFALSVLALQTKDAATLTQLVTLAATLPQAERGFVSALGWVSSEDLQGTVRALLGSKVPRHRAWALSACAMHRVDPGVVLQQATQDADVAVRAVAWRVAGQLGRLDLADAARQALLLAPGADRRAAAWALTLWGQGHNERTLEALLSEPEGQALPSQAAHRLAVMAAPMDWGREQVRALAAQAEASPVHKRRMMRMVAWVGDVQVLPWLIHHMADDKWARLAGEAFSLITGVDLSLAELERAQVDTPESSAGPTDDPEDEDVGMDDDDSLPWPDPARVQAWWQANGGRFAPGQRYVMGEPPQAAHVLGVLKQGGQRQRIMAAEYLCLLQPGSKLFPVAAPAWRQSRWLDVAQEASA